MGVRAGRVRLATRLATGLATGLLVLSGCSGGNDDSPGADPAPSATASGPTGSASPTETPTSTESPAPTPTEAESPAPPPEPVSMAGLAATEHRGDRLTLGAVREQTPGYTSYDVTFRSRTTLGRDATSLRISGVLNVPTGRGPFPAVVLAHGYIDPAYYVRGQGMTRERGYLAQGGYVALHVDYRNHAESDTDPRLFPATRLAYASDVINAIKALQATDEVPVRDQQIATFGRSMGGGVVHRALVAEPGLAAAGVAYAAVSSLEAENYRQFQAPDPSDSAEVEAVRERFGLPADSPRFWRDLSARPDFDQITEPVLNVHGRFDDTCPPAWATASQRALETAGVDSTLRWYDDGHAFGPAFLRSMADIVTFLRRSGVG